MRNRKFIDNFAENLKFLRITSGYSQRQLAAKLNLKNSGMLSHYENGKEFPNLELLNKIADFFGVSIEELLDEEYPEAGIAAFKQNFDLDTFDQTLQKVFYNCYSLIESLEKLACHIDSIKNNR